MTTLFQSEDTVEELALQMTQSRENVIVVRGVGKVLFNIQSGTVGFIEETGDIHMILNETIKAKFGGRINDAIALIAKRAFIQGLCDARIIAMQSKDIKVLSLSAVNVILNDLIKTSEPGISQVLSSVGDMNNMIKVNDCLAKINNYLSVGKKQTV